MAWLTWLSWKIVFGTILNSGSGDIVSITERLYFFIVDGQLRVTVKGWDPS